MKTVIFILTGIIFSVQSVHAQSNFRCYRTTYHDDTDYFWQITIKSFGKSHSPDSLLIQNDTISRDDFTFEVWEGDSVFIELVKNFGDEELDVQIKGSAEMLWECAFCSPTRIKKLVGVESRYAFCMAKDVPPSLKRRQILITFENTELVKDGKKYELEKSWAFKPVRKAWRFVGK
ncbi:MAG: hypothetical protein MRZ79_12630 [Bacteroidia bacterium]|nr:hypothetical protein [Bacteroidia bacterium]